MKYFGLICLLLFTSDALSQRRKIKVPVRNISEDSGYSFKDGRLTSVRDNFSIDLPVGDGWDWEREKFQEGIGITAQKDGHTLYILASNRTNFFSDESSQTLIEARNFLKYVLGRDEALGLSSDRTDIPYPNSIKMTFHVDVGPGFKGEAYVYGKGRLYMIFYLTPNQEAPDGFEEMAGSFRLVNPNIRSGISGAGIRIGVEKMYASQVFSYCGIYLLAIIFMGFVNIVLGRRLVGVNVFAFFGLLLALTGYTFADWSMAVNARQFVTARTAEAALPMLFALIIAFLPRNKFLEAAEKNEASDRDNDLKSASRINGLARSGDVDGARELAEKRLATDPNDYSVNMAYWELLQNYGELSEFKNQSRTCLNLALAEADLDQTCFLIQGMRRKGILSLLQAMKAAKLLLTHEGYLEQALDAISETLSVDERPSPAHLVSLAVMVQPHSKQLTQSIIDRVDSMDGVSEAILSRLNTVRAQISDQPTPVEVNLDEGIPLAAAPSFPGQTEPMGSNAETAGPPPPLSPGMESQRSKIKVYDAVPLGVEGSGLNLSLANGSKSLNFQMIQGVAVGVVQSQGKPCFVMDLVMDPLNADRVRVLRCTSETFNPATFLINAPSSSKNYFKFAYTVAKKSGAIMLPNEDTVAGKMKAVFPSFSQFEERVYQEGLPAF